MLLLSIFLLTGPRNSCEVLEIQTGPDLQNELSPSQATQILKMHFAYGKKKDMEETSTSLTGSRHDKIRHIVN